MALPLVTVVTPSFNQGHFIRATIESVLSQDYPHVEYLIKDGGSTDETAAVASEYSSRLTFVSEKDSGQSEAINKGFREAQGSIVSWLNSDDLYLPGAIRTAVEGFGRNPQAGAVYGEGYLLDREGRVSGRFPWTEPPNLWKLVHLSDYILQQTVFFRKDVVNHLGYLDETLHYTMDWDLLIRIGMKCPLEYIPEYMGCLREYPEAKTFTGGTRRARELHAVLRRYTGMRLPPGSIVYGLDAYQQSWCARLNRFLSGKCPPLAAWLQRGIRTAAQSVIDHTVKHSQGLYSDGWAGPLLRLMLPANSGPVWIEGVLPDWGAVFRGQTITVEANGVPAGKYPVGFGEFQFRVDPPPETHGQVLNLKLRASRYRVPSRIPSRGDRRRLAYQFRGIRCGELLESPGLGKLSTQAATAS